MTIQPEPDTRIRHSREANALFERGDQSSVSAFARSLNRAVRQPACRMRGRLSSQPPRSPNKTGDAAMRDYQAVNPSYFATSASSCSGRLLTTGATRNGSARCRRCQRRVRAPLFARARIDRAPVSTEARTSLVNIVGW